MSAPRTAQDERCDETDDYIEDDGYCCCGAYNGPGAAESGKCDCCGLPINYEYGGP